MSVRDEIQRVLSRAHADDALEPILAIVRAHRDRLADELVALASPEMNDNIDGGLSNTERAILRFAARLVRALYEEQPK